MEEFKLRLVLYKQSMLKTGSQVSCTKIYEPKKVKKERKEGSIEFRNVHKFNLVTHPRSWVSKACNSVCNRIEIVTWKNADIATYNVNFLHIHAYIARLPKTQWHLLNFIQTRAFCRKYLFHLVPFVVHVLHCFISK